MPVETLATKINSIAKLGPMTSGEFTAWKRFARASNVVAASPNGEAVSYATIYATPCDPSGVSVTSRLFDLTFGGGG